VVEEVELNEIGQGGGEVRGDVNVGRVGGD